MMDRLTWSELALDQLAELWLASQNRAAFDRTVDRIERELQYRTAEPVRHVSEGLFRYAVPPLQVLFSIDETTRVVLIVTIKPAER